MFISEIVFLTLPFVFVGFYIAINYLIANKKSVCIVVLGDIGRSPRMQYHAMSFVASGFSVDIVGYPGSDIQQELKESEKVNVYYIREPPRFLQKMPSVIAYFMKVLWMSASLLSTLLLIPKCGFILLQNPPCIPALFVSLLVCVLRGGQVVIDWHNYGYTILSMALSTTHPLVRVAKWYERWFGRFSSSNICVTKAMQTDLKENWNIDAHVLYDRPPAMFKEADLEARHDLFQRLSQEYPVFESRERSSGQCRTAFTMQDQTGHVKYVEKRPALLVSSTSWTEDEDFGVLLAALEAYEKLSNKTELPDIVCVITGKGPQKEYYRTMIESQSWNHVSFCLPWLTPEDYPKMLGSADLGVCLHKSSSGLDLPMKVVDMFGCGLPVCAVHFNCLNELVKNEVNGLVFSDSQQLLQCLQTLLHSFPSNQKLTEFRKNLSEFQRLRWHDNWTKAVLPLFTDDKKNK